MQSMCSGTSVGIEIGNLSMEVNLVMMSAYSFMPVCLYGLWG